MVNTFFEALKNAQTWFFGSALMADPFFSGCINIFNAVILIGMFYGLILYPLRWCLSLLISRIKGVDDD